MTICETRSDGSWRSEKAGRRAGDPIEVRTRKGTCVMPVKEPVILFADGNLSWGRGARVELRRRGAQVSTAASVDDALRAAKESPPDLLILQDDLEGHQGR